MMASSTAIPNTRTATATPSDEGIATLHANEMAAKMTSYKTLQPTTTITMATISANTAKNNANDAGEATRVDTATDASSTNNVGSRQRPFTYTHKEVWQLIEDAQIDGWQEGYEEGSRKWSEGHKAGYEAGQKMGKEKEEMARKEGRLEWYELGIQQGRDEERRKWLVEGHGPGMCEMV